MIPTDGTKLSAKAVKTGLALAKHLSARVTAVHVMPPYTLRYYEGMIVYVPPSGMDSRAYKRATEKHAREILTEVTEKARIAGINCGSAFVTDLQPWNAILKLFPRKKMRRHCDGLAWATWLIRVFAR